MKKLPFSLLAALSLGTAALTFPQDSHPGRAPTPVVTEVGHGMAIDPGRIAVLGENLGLIRTVRLDGVEQPVVRKTSKRLVFEPAPGLPGFHALEFDHGGGRILRTLELTPTLAVRRAGDYLAVTIHGSDRGWYEVDYSFRLAGTPQYYPGINFPSLLDFNTPYSGIAYANFLPDGNRVTVFWEVPTMMTLHAPVHLQALCTTLDGVMCYSNAITVLPGHVRPETMTD